ncbi:MAG: hypothetical protein ACPLKP_01085 [Microgenomates group bacterium]
MKKKKTKKQFDFFKFTVLILGILIIFQIIISCWLVSLSAETKNWQVKLSQLNEEIKILNEELAKETSLKKISQKAEELGLVKTSVVFHLTEDNAVALRK